MKFTLKMLLALFIITSEAQAINLGNWSNCSNNPSGSIYYSDCMRSPWKKEFRSLEEGMELSIDFQMTYNNYVSNKPYNYLYITELFVNLSGRKFTPSDKVRVVFNNKMKNLGQCGSRAYDWNEIVVADLKLAPGGHMYVDLIKEGKKKRTFENIYDQEVGRLSLHLNPYCRTQTSVGQEISFVINGKWYSNIPFSLAKEVYTY